MTFHSNSELLQLIQSLEAYDDWVFVEQYTEQQLEIEWYIETVLQSFDAKDVAKHARKATEDRRKVKRLR